MPTPAHPSFEYREASSLDEVNRLAKDDGYELLQAVAVDGALRYLLRRTRDRDAQRRVGFSADAGGGS